MWLLALVACGGGSPLDTGPTPAASGRCDDVPVLTWENFGDKATALGLADAILSSATGDAPRMPPRGGVSDDDREKLDIWLQCWEGQ